MKPLSKTLGELRATGYRPERVRQEIRRNMVRAIRERQELFPGIIGYEDTVVPQVVHAALAEHNFLLLGQRGQAKTRLIRGLTEYLDDVIPIIDGSPVPEDPLHPITPTGRRLAREAGDDLPIVWLERANRYQEKLATPDVTIADLIGDIDPIKAMSRKLDFSNEEVIHYGLVPRSNRCIFAINEIPDLQPRIQVGLLNILEERDFQIRGFPIRMEIDLFVVFTANPEDYTNRGNIITPLKDRIEAQIITHYPTSLEDGIAIIKQESWGARNGHVDLKVSELFYHLIEATAIEARQSDYVDRNSGVSARMPITLLETAMSSMERRALLNGDRAAHARVCDLYLGVPAITGKVELVYKGEQEGIAQVAEHLVGKSIKERFNELFVPDYKRGRDPKHEFTEFQEIIGWFEDGNTIDLNDTMTIDELQASLDRIPTLGRIAARTCPGLVGPDLYSAMEFLLEGLAQNFMLSKFKLVRGTRYADELYSMQKVED